MNRRLIFVGMAILGVCLFLAMRKGGAGANETGAAIAEGKAAFQHELGNADATGMFRTRSGDRPPAAPKASHLPDELPQFMLPELPIDGLSLEEALRKLKSLYEEVCGQTGESPVALRFIMPPTGSRLLHLRLPPGNMDSSIRVLAAVSGMKLGRKGATYTFTKPGETGDLLEKELKVPPDLNNALAALVGGDEAAAMLPLPELIEMLGIELDVTSRITLGATGFLAISSRSAADMAMVEGLLASVNPPVQHKLQTRQVVIPAGTNIDLPEDRQLTAVQTQLFMRELAQRSGIMLTTLPSIMARSGQSANIAITKELIAPIAGSDTKFQRQDVGKILKIETDALGFGHHVGWSFQDSSGDVDPRTKALRINMHADMNGSGFNGDQRTQLSVEERPDGSRVILLLTPTLIDPAGRPLREE